MDNNSLRAQLAPGWTPLNILIMVALFVFVWWPLGLLMLAYILFGANLGLNLAEPATFKDAFTRLTGGTATGTRPDTGSPTPVQPNTNEVRDEAERLSLERGELARERANLEQERVTLEQERENLARERANFEAEKQVFEQQRHEDA